jgi:hypothetical protein
MPTPVSRPAIRKPSDLDARVGEVERSIAAAEAYDAAENLIGAYGYYLDESPGDVAGLFVGSVRKDEALDRLGPGENILVNQLMQPVIGIAPGGKSAKVRARLLDPGDTSVGAGYWTAGTFEGQIVLEQGAWRFETARSSSAWSARYPGGWARIP